MLFEAMTLPRGPAWRNRIALAPMTNKQSHPDGSLSEDEIRWLVARAEGGMGQVMTAAAYVRPAGKAWIGQLGVHDDAMLPGLTRLAAELRAAGAVSAVQLHHGGVRADPAVNGRPLEGPWDDERTGVVAMATGEVRHVVDDFVAAAARAERAGFDGCQIHGAHGYLITEFLSRRNERTDGYGGPLAARTRMLREILEGIRATTGPDFQLGLRLSPERNGVELADAVSTARWALASGLLDTLDMSLWNVLKEPDDHPGRLLIDHFAELDRGHTRLSVAGRIHGAADAQRCLDQGVDAVTIGTAAILHHDFAVRALADAGFEQVAKPVSREYLAGQDVSPPFVDYLAAGWKDFVER